MHTIIRRALIAGVVLSASLGTPHAQPAPKGSEATGQSSTMGTTSGDTSKASNGVGTAGSLDHDAGKASSTVAGINGSTTSMSTQKQSEGPSKPKENEPSVGGGSQAPK